jgi:LacI family transcriptional regulator
MTRRPTILELAREAGVSVATVDRVLNGRLKVREETARKVADAAQRIGYHARGQIDQRLAPEVPSMHFGFVLHKQKQEFYQDFAREIKAAVAERRDIRGRATIRFSPSQLPEDFSKEMLELGPRIDALASSAVNHPTVNAAVEKLRDLGVPTFALLNDFAQGVRQNYHGLNNMKVGRIAASMISMTVRKPGKIAVFVGGNRWHGHELRETGFRSFFRDTAPAFTVLDTQVNLETRQMTYEACLDLLYRHPDLVGIYVAGGGMEGAIAALREVRPARKVALVVNELVSDSREGLLDGYVTMVIQTPLDELCRALVDDMVDATLNGLRSAPGQHFLEPHLFIPESI